MNPQNRILHAFLNATWLRGGELLAAQLAWHLTQQITQQRAPALPRVLTPVVNHSPMWFGRKVLRAIGVVAVAGIVNLSVYPLAVAMGLPKASPSWKITDASADRQLTELIDNVRATLMSPSDSVMRKEFDPKATLAKFDTLVDSIDASMQAERDAASAKNANPTALAKLDALKQQFDARSKIFRGKLADLVPQGLIFKTAKSDGADLNQWLDQVSPLKKAEDFKEMPFQTLKPNRNNVPRDFEAEQSATLSAKSLTLTPKAAGNFTDPQYLASTAETVITADIQAKAQELHNNAIEIYNWVRNNVEWQPTWGGQQTADMTLDVKRGNAMDIATLTIALLRAANIPARYAYGTVDIPADQFMNMAGDFADINAAWDFASAGGIPITGVISGGTVTKLRIEHVWVEAAVPYYPARGVKPASARNPIDTWVPLDPSYKQYTYLQGIDAQTIAGIDGQQLANNFTNSGTVNEQEGWVQGLDSTIIQNAQTQAQQKLTDYINNMQNPTVGDVIGGRTIQQKSLPYLPDSLPYPKSAKGSTYGQLPANLQVRVTLGLGWDQYDQSYLQQNTWPLYQLNQRSITISFKPATTADENALKALIPPNVTDPSQLPSFLPSSINVIPEIKRDDEVLLTGSTLALGEEVRVGYQISNPQTAYFNKYYDVIAGSYLALGVVGSNMSQKTFTALQTNLQQTKQTLNSGTDAEKAALTRERLLGDMYVSGIQGYYAQYATQGMVLSLKTRIMYQPIPVMGTFGYEPNQRTLFGLNRGIEVNGLFMNVYTAQAIKDRLGDSDKAKQLMLEVGILSSSLESGVPEQMFADTNNATQPQGFSTAKALAMATAQGQKIYTINQQNQTAALSALHLDSLAMSEISNALASGKEITTHTDQLTVPGYKGSGYAITDPLTGAGIYKISGGKNGGYLGLGVGAALGAAVIGLTSGEEGKTSLTIAVLTDPVVDAILSFIATLLSIFSIMDTLQFGEQKTLTCFLAGLYVGYMWVAGITPQGSIFFDRFLLFLGFAMDMDDSRSTLKACGVPW